jgi:hypothetical protein
MVDNINNGRRRLLTTFYRAYLRFKKGILARHPLTARWWGSYCTALVYRINALVNQL